MSVGHFRPPESGSSLCLLALDRKVVPPVAADAPDAVRDPRHLLRRVVVKSLRIARSAIPTKLCLVILVPCRIYRKSGEKPHLPFSRW